MIGDGMIGMILCTMLHSVSLSLSPPPPHQFVNKNISAVS